MLSSGLIGCTRERLERVWSSRLAILLRPASSGPVRFWQDQIRLAVKGAIAAVGAWALARYAVGQPDPYFAPLAALLGVYSTAAQHLARLTSEIINEVAEHQAAGDDPAAHHDKCHHRGGGDDTAVRDLSG